MNLDATMIQEYIATVVPELFFATLETLYMVLFSSLFALAIGMVVGTFLYITDKDGIMPNKWVSLILGTIVNILRSIPFIILIIAIFPLTRLIVGTSIGSTAAIVPLTLGAAPFAARVIESAFKEIDRGVIEAAKAMGATNFQIIRKVILPEASQSIVLATTTTIINLIGYTAMAGAIGGGGLGDLAIRYGQNRFRADILLYTIIILVVMVQGMQWVGNRIAKRLKKY